MHNKNNPFNARILEKVNLCAPDSAKETQHIVLDLKGSGLAYEVGDCVAVMPVHDPELLEQSLRALKMSGDEKVSDVRSGSDYSLRAYLLRKASLMDLNKRLVHEIAQRHCCNVKRGKLLDLLKAENREYLKSYVEERHLPELLEEHQEVTFSPQEICQLLKPLLPRFYSIASSQKAVPDEVHLTVKKQVYNVGEKLRYGVCSRYLCDLASTEQQTIPIYIQSNHGFTLPLDPSAPMIMVGPGTGVAPFRSFMQERVVTGASGRNWLFFGDWSRRTEFLYGDYWLGLESQGKLKLDLAFSRDQSEKIYVQHRMMEKGREIYRWLEEGAYFYVCGDAKLMAKDVERALLAIVIEHGGKSEEEALQYIRKLRHDKRYSRDVY